MNVRKDFIQLLKFGLVGIANTLIDFGIFVLLHGYLQVFYAFAQVISYSCGMANSYFLNKFWTFQSRRAIQFHEVFKFVAVNLLSLGVSLLLLYLVRGRGSWGVVESKIFATSGSLLVNFVGNKFWVFAENRK
ncbi:MAG: GtrA family protein [Atribacterota bacterium]|nr:GtrA family protein [Atribacterota bacterium]